MADPHGKPGDNALQLKHCRDAIDAIDRELLKLLNERARQAQVIGSLKGGGPAYRPEREAQVLRALQEQNAGPLPDESVAGVFRQIIAACLALEQKLRVAYLGPPGTFSHGAVARHFGDFIDAEPYASIDEVFRAAESGQTDHAVVPVENSTEGAVGRTLDLMCQTELNIVGEIKLRIAQHLLSTARRWPRSRASTRMRNRWRSARNGLRDTCPPCRAFLWRATRRRRAWPRRNLAPRPSPAR